MAFGGRNQTRVTWCMFFVFWLCWLAVMILSPLRCVWTFEHHKSISNSVYEPILGTYYDAEDGTETIEITDYIMVDQSKFK